MQFVEQHGAALQIKLDDQAGVGIAALRDAGRQQAARIHDPHQQVADAHAVVEQGFVWQRGR